MAGLERVVVGYRENDRRRYKLAADYGLQSVAVRRCIAGCGHPVFFVASGQDAARTRDAEVICDDCWQREKHNIYREL